MTQTVITQRSGQVFLEVLGALCQNARETGVTEIPVRDQTGATIATVTLHALPKRPKDMPRALRPKQKLSKRQRAAARRAKLEKVPA